MNTNIANNNTEKDFTISTTTGSMLRLMQDFQKLQERAIALYEDKTGGEKVVDATVTVHHAMEAAIISNICATLEETDGATI